jgi:hypothetical protein
MNGKHLPVLEMEMTKQGCKISLADDKARLEATLPKVFMDYLVAKWLAFQDGTANEPMAHSRHYVGAWGYAQVSEEKAGAQ